MLHLSIYQTDWPAKTYFCAAFSSLIHPSLLFFLAVTCFFCPSVALFLISDTLLALFLTLLLCVSSSPAVFLVSTQLKGPEGASFKHRNQKHMAHFQLPRSITAIYPEIAAKFPKVSSRFTTDCNVCLSHLKPGHPPTTTLLHRTRCDFPSNISKAFKWALHMFYLWLSCPLSFSPHLFPQLCWVQLLLATQI